MLSQKARPVIIQTLPVIGERISEITPNFYKRLFSAHPELLDGTFSRSNQRNGTQQQALAGSIVAFSKHLVENPDTLPEQVLSRIAHKHASLGIVPEQYPIVYEHLFGAIAENLGDALTPEIAEAWTEVYWLMADALIKIEKQLYAKQANNVFWATWELTKREDHTENVTSFFFSPTDDTGVTPAVPGQFVSLKVKLTDGIRQARQYSLSSEVANPNLRVITVKSSDDGEVSKFIRHNLAVGDRVELSNPYGDVTFNYTESQPLIVATAGIGNTPASALLEALVNKSSQTPIQIIHAEESWTQWALADQVTGYVDKLPNAKLDLWLADAPAIAPRQFPGHIHSGRVDVSALNLDDEVLANARIYLCGPLGFMRSVRDQFINSGAKATNIHYEVFGPDLWLAA